MDRRLPRLVPPVGGKRNPEENVTNNVTNENPRKKTFSLDTTKEG
jgi:hypothetical protein